MQYVCLSINIVFLFSLKSALFRVTKIKLLFFFLVSFEHYYFFFSNIMEFSQYYDTMKSTFSKVFYRITLWISITVIAHTRDIKTNKRSKKKIKKKKTEKKSHLTTVWLHTFNAYTHIHPYLKRINN